MGLAYSDAILNAKLEAIRTNADAGALINIYDGSQPARGAAITTQTLLAQCVMSVPAFGAVTNNSITANAISQDASADNTGSPTWFRMTDSDGTFVMDGTATDLGINGTTITQGTSTVDITSFVINGANVG